MRLPTKIYPNPLVTSIVEIRFSSAIVGSRNLLPKIYSQFASMLPNLSASDIPAEIKEKNPRFKYNADFILSNDDFSLSFSDKAISFENVSEYKLWDNYFAFIQSCLSEVFKMNFINSIERIGVRYASVLENVKGIEVLKYNPSISIDGYTENINLFRTILSKEDCNLLLQISPNSKASKGDKTKSGLLVDIDASFQGNLSLSNELFDKINKLHLFQKELFFGILKENFIETLKPIY